MNEYNLDFISQEDFEKHVLNTIKEYKDTLKGIDLSKFNSNIIDPIKLLFDKNVFNKSYEEIIDNEIHRQKDKTNNNSIGYFHQNIFRYIKNCEVPNEGWDVIVRKNNKILCVEIKNKHNTMNSSSSSKIYMKMQNELLLNYNKDLSCVLVEIISKKSADKEWIITLDKEKQKGNPRLRRMSVDKFYEYVTGDKMSFNKLCMQLPITIEKIIKENKSKLLEEDTVFSELKELDDNILLALYKLAFSSYEGFENLGKKL